MPVLLEPRVKQQGWYRRNGLKAAEQIVEQKPGAGMNARDLLMLQRAKQTNCWLFGPVPKRAR
jgi:hypothetical protein